MPEPLRVDPTELHLIAGRLEGHTSDFLAAHSGSHWRAAQVSIGSGAASAALRQMLCKWEDDGGHFAARLTKHAEDHREAAVRYINTDTVGADAIDAADPAP
ncbi:hypothetical protein MSP7336_01383 [Mycobacterium shimoidei]|uniref:Uncharacterized protein n=1 Tax=Mycobacterium shimoidei TaxID=29313 RepID=A0A375YW86_MYCSH|nr:hypothetical protein MSP7336_01383 [Mycobacterium shimoidei]